MAFPLMPKATAVWLVDNTTLTFDQIAEFCGLHPLEVQALADGDVGAGIIGSSPIASGELTQDEIARCEKTSTARLKMIKNDLPKPKSRAKGPRYTPVAKRAEKPNAILFLIRKYPEMTDAQICRLIGTTKPTVKSIRDKNYPTFMSLKPQDPVMLGLCTHDEMSKLAEKIERKKERDAKTAAKAAKASGATLPASFEDNVAAEPAAADDAQADPFARSESDDSDAA